ncbi:MAG: gas vesicle protein [Chloroflexi bacterium]|nr:gas vesicle protein [Chloroflexota bacterium]
MNTGEIVKKVQGEFTSFSRLPVSAIIGLSRTDEGWLVSLEALERKAIPDTMDVLGTYEVCVDADGNLLRFERKGLRKRCQTQTD